MSFAGLDVWLRSRAAADLFSGVVLIRRGERTLFAGAYGWASRRWAAPVTLTTRFDTASITKLFTAVAALQLVDQGRLDLDTPIVDVVDLTASAISPVVTVRQLLTHTSGIADDADEEAGEDYEALWADKPCYSVIETRDWLPQFAHKPAVFPPGAGCRYCNVGYILVGLAIEAVTGVDYRDHVRGAVFTAAAMAASDFYDRREAVRNCYKDGANAGASGIVRYYPTGQLDVVVLSNSAAGAWPAIDEIHRRIGADNPGIGDSGAGLR